MKKIIVIAASFLILGVSNIWAQQIPMFNSYILNRFLVNPAYAGHEGRTNFYALNRLQFAGFEGAPVTYMMTGDAGFKDKKFGLGGVVFSDRNNVISQTGFQIAYSYGVKLNEKWKLGMGLNAGMVRWALNFDQILVDDPNENILTNARSNASTFRSDFGLNISSDKLEIGIAMPQIMSSKVNYNDYLRNSNGNFTAHPHFVVNAGYWLNINKEDVRLKPMVLVRGSKDIQPQIDVIGLLDWKKRAYASVGYRTNFAFTLGGGFHMPGGLTVGYNFDRPLNEIKTFSNGSHELVIGYTFQSGSRSGGSAGPSASPLSQKEAEDRIKKEVEEKVNQGVQTRINQSVEETLYREIQKLKAELNSTGGTKPANTTGETAPATTGPGLKKEDLDQIKKDMDEKIKKEVAERVKKELEGKGTAAPAGPATTTPAATAQVKPEDVEKIKKEVEEKVKKEVEEKIRKELEVKIKKEVEEGIKKEMDAKVNKAIEERMAIETKKAKEAADKANKEYKLSNEDRKLIDSLTKKDLENEKRMREIEMQLKIFPDKSRIEKSELERVKKNVLRNDAELKKMKKESEELFEKSGESTKKSNKTEEGAEAERFVIVLAAFHSLTEAQEYQKIATQSFEFTNTRVIKPDEEGWFFVYESSFDSKKQALKEFVKTMEASSDTPKAPWIYVRGNFSK